MGERVFVAGVGMIPFVKPGANDPYPVMATRATHLALADAGLTYDRIQHAYVGYVYGDSTCGQRALYEIGLTGIPIFNVNNNCSSGSTALYLARQAVEAGVVDCALALGFEQMMPGALNYAFPDRPANEFVIGAYCNSSVAQNDRTVRGCVARCDQAGLSTGDLRQRVPAHLLHRLESKVHPMQIDLRETAT